MTTILKITFEDTMGQEYTRYYTSYKTASKLLMVTVDDLVKMTSSSSIWRKIGKSGNMTIIGVEVVGLDY